MYKLIAIDLDGTLLTYDRSITKENLDFIHFLITKGYEIVIATGRSYYSARVLTENINEHLIYICNNGNIVRDAIDDRVIFTNYLDPKDSKILLQEGIARGLYPFIHANYFDEGYDVILGKNHYPIESLSKARDNLLRIKIIEDNLEENLEKVLAFVYPNEFDNLIDGFNRNGKELKPYNLISGRTGLNSPGGIYVYDTLKDDGKAEEDTSFNQWKTSVL